MRELARRFDPARATLDLDDVQGIVLHAYRLPRAAYCFYRFSSPLAGRRWMASLTPSITTARITEAASCVNLALTHPGLGALGLPATSLSLFPDDFREGMAARARHLGDVGANAPERWESAPPAPPFRARQVHALVLVAAEDDSALEAELARVRERADRAGGVELVGRQHAGALPDRKEHFGFRDGISQPVVEGSGVEPLAGQQPPLRPGEFVLGHPDQTGAILPLPHPVCRNGSYLVYRKLSQDVSGFRAFLRSQSDDPATRDLLAARMVGRWPSGAPLVLAPGADDPTLGDDPARNNDFGYVTADPRGLACPRGAHVRRANRRDGALTNDRRRLLRRGLPYGPPLAEGADDGADRGMVGVLVNANISRQFEFVQRVWLADPKFDGLSDDEDPLVGSREAGADFTVQRRPFATRLYRLPRFVTLRGGEYFLVPGVAGLRELGGGR